MEKQQHASGKPQPTVADIVRILDARIPPELAYEWDSVGLQAGDPRQEVHKIMLSLDASHSRVIAEAAAKEADLLIAHHPLLFKPVKQILATDPYQLGIQQLIKHNISVFAAHTNWDIVTGGVNQVLADRLGLCRQTVLDPHDNRQGIGVIGELAAEVTLLSFAESVQKQLPTRGLRWVGSPNRPVKRVAVLGGAGSKWIRKAFEQGADVLVTGDVTYHDAQFAEEIGLAVVDPGHYALEQPSMLAFRQLLQTELAQRNWHLEILLSEENTDPFFFSGKSG